MKSEFLISSLDDLRALAKQLVAELQSKNIFLLQGPMGAGKTQLVRYLVEELGGAREVQSPSFALHNRYILKWGEVDHFDLMRVENDEEIDDMGFWDCFDAEKALLLVEWPEKIDPSHLPKNWNKLLIEFNLIDKNNRKIKLRPL